MTSSWIAALPGYDNMMDMNNININRYQQDRIKCEPCAYFQAYARFDNHIQNVLIGDEILKWMLYNAMV